MKTIKRPVRLGIIVLILLLAVLVAVKPLVPESLAGVLLAAWLLWILAALWLGWSLLKPWLFGGKTEAQVEVLAQQANEAMDRFEDSLSTLTHEEAKLRQKLEDAQTYQREVTKVLIGFIEQADLLKMKVATFASGSMGNITFHDATFARLLSSLGETDRQNTLETEVGILEEQELAFRRQAQLLLNRVIEARGLIAQQQVKLKTTEAAQPLLQMNHALEGCQQRLAYLNHGLPAPQTIQHILIQRRVS